LVMPGPIPGPTPNSWWFYYLGVSIGHDVSSPAQATNIGGFGRFLLTIDA